MEVKVNCEKEFIYSQEEISRVAQSIIDYADDVSVWLFEGEMGAGKTTLIKEICKALGVHETVSSPTYSLVNEYRDAKGNDLYHFDFYRINNEEEASDIGADDYFYSGEYCFIEWPTKIPSLLPDSYCTISIKVVADYKRKVCLTKKIVFNS
jgi:tRNA threonylcarbamoyladenosine biosynthesis protein TsaE